jgi:hypothetical protein
MLRRDTFNRAPQRIFYPAIGPAKPLHPVHRFITMACAATLNGLDADQPGRV